MERNGEGFRLLLIDDDRGLLPSLAALIQTLTNYTVITAVNGAEGLARCLAEPPHCVVVDVKMPELDGYQFVRAIRGDPVTAATPVIFLSAMARQEDRFQGLAAGGDQYLIKPVKPQVLLAAIQTAIAYGENERLQRLQTLAEMPHTDEDDLP